MPSVLTRLISWWSLDPEQTPTRGAIAATILTRALAATALFAVIFFGMTGWEWFESRGRPTEDTVIVSVHDASGSQRCGKYDREPNKLVTRRSSNPPEGLPEVFTHVEACGLPEVGDRETVVRVPRGAEEPKVYLEPARSFGAVMGYTLLATGGIFVLAIVTVGVAELWHSWRRRRRRLPAS